MSKTEKTINGIVLYSYNSFIIFSVEHKYKRIYTSLLWKGYIKSVQNILYYTMCSFFFFFCYNVQDLQVFCFYLFSIEKLFQNALFLLRKEFSKENSHSVR